MEATMTTGAPTVDARDLAREYGGMVSALCRRMIRDPEAAADAAQDAWVAVISSLPGFRGESKPGTWIYRIVTRSLGDRFAREKRYSTRYLAAVFHDEAFVSPYEAREETACWAREQCDRCLTGILHCLDTESRLVFLFRELVGLDWSDVASALEISEAAARQTGSRGKRKLRRFLNRECSLFNPDGPCRCRMATAVKSVDLPREYERMRTTVDRMRLFREAESLAPRRNFWMEAVTNQAEA